MLDGDLILLAQGHTIVLRHQAATVRLHLVTVSSACHSIFHENNGASCEDRRKFGDYEPHRNIREKISCSFCLPCFKINFVYLDTFPNLSYILQIID